MANEGFITLNDLQTRFRAAGVYTVYRDLTASPAARSNPILRLVVGFSKTGPFNTPVFIEQGDFATAERLYGTLDKSLERKGSYFHRALQTSLEEGAVLALNLLNLDNEVDQNGVPTINADVVPYQSFSTDVVDINGIPRNKLYSSYYDKERFWKPSKSFLLATRDIADAGSIFNIVNLSQQPISFIMRKSLVRGFDIPVTEWYGEIGAEIPPYVRPHDLISDYFIDVIAVAGSWDNYTQLSVDPVFGQYFTPNGLIIEELDNFLNRTEVTVIESFTGSLITNFRDTNGVTQYIEDIINQQTRVTGILAAIDREELDKYEDDTNSKFLDLVGHRLLTNPTNQTDWLSYKRKLNQDFTYTEKGTNATQVVDSTTGVTLTPNPAEQKITVTVDNTNPNFAAAQAGISVGTLFLGVTTAAGTTAGITLANPVLEVTKFLDAGTQITFDVSSPLKDGETGTSGSFVDLDLAGTDFTFETENDRFYRDGTNTWYIADENSQIYQDFDSGDITSGDTISDISNTYYARFTKTRADGGIDVADDYREVLYVELFTDAALTIPVGAGSAPAFGTTLDSNGFVISTPTELNFVSVVGAVNGRFDADFIDNKTVQVPIAFEGDFSADDYLVGFDADGNDILARIVSIKRVGSPTPTHIEIETANIIKSFTSTGGQTQVERYKPIEQFYEHYNITAHPGFQIKEKHMPNNTNQRMKDIQSVMTDTNLRDALIDPEMIDWRYYVDTFNHGLEPQSKRHLTRLFRDRQTALGLLNTPSVDEFRDSQNPRFTDTPTASDPLPSLNVGYIEAGGNISENPDFLYTMPEEEDGASFAGFFFPNIIVRDTDGEFIGVPPAALVGNQFMKKFRGGNPFKPVAGPRRGVLTGDGLSGVEYELTRTDRGALEAKGINPIYQKRDGTILIFGNETAYKRFNSVLNNLNVRDTLITLQIEIEAILSNFVFEFNDDALKTEVTALIRNYLESIQNGFGAISDFDIIFDRNNNPGWVVRENAAIVDVIVEPTDVVKKFVNRITLKKDAEPAVGGFVSV